MSVFELRGPDFLLVYVTAIAGACFLIWLFRYFGESGEPGALGTDPYLIAYLRGGASEAVKVCMVSLVDRGLLGADGTELEATSRPDTLRRPIERELLARYQRRGKATPAVDAWAMESVAALRRSLEGQLLIPDAGVRLRRLVVFAALLATLLAAGWHKAQIGLSRGRPIELLVVLMIAAPFALGRTTFKRRTMRGDRALRDLESLFAGLKDRAPSLQAGGATNEASLLMAVFGAAAMPGQFFWVESLFPKPQSSGGDSSCGSSCGGGCGGGGCGGCGS